jgi:excinuclease ABC subunit A
MATEFIKIGGARQHNLKNITLSLPREKLIVVTGLSGSGKSSLAFDTLFAEGQRKYVESLSTYARQFLDQMEKPDVDYIEGLSPAIAIEQMGSASNPRSTIATTTELYDHFRVLFATLGQPHCPDTGVPVSRMDPADITDRILALEPKTRVMLAAPVVQDDKGEFRDVLERLGREGFVRARIDGELAELSATTRIKLDPKKRHRIEVIVDRLVVEEKVRVRLSDSVETALRWGSGSLLALHQPPDSTSTSPWSELPLSTRCVSPVTGKSFERVTPRHFSFNSPAGACPVCHGLGQKMVFDPALVVPIEDKSLEDGAVLPFRRGGKRMIVYYKALLRGLAAHFGVSLETPFKDLPASFRDKLLYGTDDEAVSFTSFRAGKTAKADKPFEGVLPHLARLYQESESEFTRNRLKAFMNPTRCDACDAQRLKPEVLGVTVGGAELASRFLPKRPARTVEIPGLSIMDVCALSVDEADSFFAALTMNETERKLGSEVLAGIRARLGFLKNVGLGYLALNRESATLSGGEAQRIRLATQIGAGLVGVVYILDEPSIGLHQRDNERLIATLDRLRDLGNTVIVVEHDEDTMRRADYLVDMGPGAGIHGGQVVAAGTLAEVCANPRSLTGRYLNGELSVEIPKVRLKPSDRGWLEVVGAEENNLKNVHARFPLGVMTCVTGVSGSGKSTLVNDILCRALLRRLYGAKDHPGVHRELRGHEQIDKVVVIDQSAIGRTPRSNPATYTGVFNQIRDLFARLPAAKVRGYSASRFSFNVKGGRCEKCQGDGLIKTEMLFLPPVYVTCEGCGGKRYNRETLEISYKGMNIADVLAMSVDEAVTFFRAVPKIHDPCLKLAEVGLGYVKLGQSGTTLSGGEAQRIKLAAELSRKATGRTVYILDEPTTGLHFHDVETLLRVLFKLRAAGNTLIVIEHNLDVIKTADWVIDLGPEGGAGGGRIVVEGPPELVAADPGSETGRFLSRILRAQPR